MQVKSGAEVCLRLRPPSRAKGESRCCRGHHRQHSDLSLSTASELAEAGDSADHSGRLIR